MLHVLQVPAVLSKFPKGETVSWKHLKRGTSFPFSLEFNVYFFILIGIALNAIFCHSMLFQDCGCLLPAPGGPPILLCPPPPPQLYTNVHPHQVCDCSHIVTQPQPIYGVHMNGGVLLVDQRQQQQQQLRQQQQQHRHAKRQQQQQRPLRHKSQVRKWRTLPTPHSKKPRSKWSKNKDIRQS